MHLLPRLLAAVVIGLGAFAPAAVAAPPPNDGPATAAPFETFTARVGVPDERHAVAELAEATSDPGVPSCLGPESFARTVWFRIDPAPGIREITVSATGQTLELVDLAGFVQPVDGLPQTIRPNACAGAGVDGADAAEDRTAALTVRVPPYQALLVQVGRRGTPGSPAVERAQLELFETTITGRPPKGDHAGEATQTIRRNGYKTVRITGATTSEEDVATPGCPAYASVWRRYRPRRTGRLTFTAEGPDAATLAIFRGREPTRENFQACVDRDGDGPLMLPMRVKRRKLLWIRVGTDRPPAGATARLGIRNTVAGDRAGGGGCLGKIRPARLSGSPARSERRVRILRRSRYLSFSLRVARGPLCGAQLRLTGPGGRTYARAELWQVAGGGQTVTLRRTRKLRKGRYHLRARAYGVGRTLYDVRSNVSFTLR